MPFVSNSRRSLTARSSPSDPLGPGSCAAPPGGQQAIPASAFSHVVAGGAFAALAPTSVPVARLALVLAVASALPDLDVIAFRLDIAYGHPLGHRGFSHSLLFAALLAPALARLAGVRPGGAIRPYLVVCSLGFLAVVSHGLLDALTDAGLGVGFFIPASDERFFFSWRPIMTSPIGVETFFTSRGLEILLHELVWIIVPAAICAVVVRLLMKRRRRGESAGC